MNISEMVRSLCKEVGISLAEVSRRIGQSPQNLSKKINRQTLTFDEFEQILKCLNIEMNVDFILPGQKVIKSSMEDDVVNKQMEIMEMALELERKKIRYFTDVSFDFRTSLDVVGGGMNLILNHSSDQAKVEEYVNKIMPAISELTRLVEDSPFNREISTGSNKAISEVSADKIKGKCMLLVEDNEINRSIERDLLEDKGVVVVEAVDGADALKQITEAKEGFFDFVLMDLQMDNMDGFEATEAIRKLPNKAKADIPIIAMTAMVSEDEQERARVAGMNGFTKKPLDIKSLLCILQTEL
ncbi:MAG: response regulator [Saccharofermentans sp.]|nr:response regulator [Saccharofermentans sp.]